MSRLIESHQGKEAALITFGVKGVVYDKQLLRFALHACFYTVKLSPLQILNQTQNVIHPALHIVTDHRITETQFRYLHQSQLGVSFIFILGKTQCLFPRESLQQSVFQRIQVSTQIIRFNAQSKATLQASINGYDDV